MRAGLCADLDHLDDEIDEGAYLCRRREVALEAMLSGLIEMN
jgi:hypothetical protein